MFRILTPALSAACHAAVAWAHVCECAARAPNVPAHQRWAAVACVVLSALSLALVVGHLTSRGSAADSRGPLDPV